MQVQRQDPPIAIANPQGDMARTIAEMLRKVENLGGVRPNLVMFLLPTISVEPYATIKGICDTQYGIASQCMIVEKALSQKGQQQYLGNIALKVNVKLGGVNSRIEDPFLRHHRTIVIGCDAAHPNPSQRRLNPPPPTFTALAANYDAACTQYTAVTATQDPGAEIVRQFGPMAGELLRRYRKRTGQSPESVLYFRDGVSETEFGAVLAEELEALKSKSSPSFNNTRLTNLCRGYARRKSHRHRLRQAPSHTSISSPLHRRRQTRQRPTRHRHRERKWP